MWGEWDRRKRMWVAGGVALVALVAVPAALLAAGSHGGTPSSSSGGGGGGTSHNGSGSTSSTTTLVPTTTPITLAPVVPPSTTPTTAVTPIVTGRVTRAGGAPEPHAYVIGLDNLATVQTDKRGDFSMPCTGQPLVASPWLVPVTAGGAVVAGYDPGKVPRTLGDGYLFSGGATDASKAVSASCNGKPVNIRLPVGATVVVNLFQPGGAPFVPAPGQVVDTFVVPGFGGRAAPVTVPVSAKGVQVLPQLGAGQLTIQAAQGSLTCRGAGVSPTTAAPAVSVAASAGNLVVVKCKVA